MLTSLPRLMVLAPLTLALASLPAQQVGASPAPAPDVSSSPLPVAGQVKPMHRVIQGPANPFAFPIPVADTLVFDEGSSLQIGFADVRLQGGSRIELTSLVDGDTQVLTAEDFENGSGESAYFNGNAIRLRLIAGGGAPAPSLRIRDLAVGNGNWIGTPQTICGSTDNRAFTQHGASARMIIKRGSSTYICSAWLVSTKNGMATAGHCLSGTITSITAQFNVPLSTSSGAYVNPPATSQYTWISSSRQYQDSGPGNDYGVFRVNTSSSLYPYSRQGTRFTTVAPAVGTTHSRNGFGSASGTLNYAPKTHSGALSSVSGYSVRFNTLDSTGGDSGSVYYRNGTQAIGAHTHGGCTASGGYNSGTSVSHPTFASWIAGVQN